MSADDGVEISLLDNLTSGVDQLGSSQIQEGQQTSDLSSDLISSSSQMLNVTFEAQVHNFSVRQKKFPVVKQFIFYFIVTMIIICLKYLQLNYYAPEPQGIFINFQNGICHCACLVLVENKLKYVIECDYFHLLSSCI